MTDAIIEVSATSAQTEVAATSMQSVVVSFDVPDGYTIQDIKRFYIGGWAGICLQGTLFSGNTVAFYVYNTTASVRTATIQATVNCRKL